MMKSYRQQQLNDQGLIPDSSTREERRQHLRSKMNNQVLSFNEDILAEVVDISGSGMLCQCPASVDKSLNKIDEIELLNCELGTSITGLHCRLVHSRKKPISPAPQSTMIINFSLEFIDLSKIKHKQLFQFIQSGAVAPP